MKLTINWINIEQGGETYPAYLKGVLKMQNKIYAAYGSNMNISQMAKRCPAAKVIGTGTLKDYRLTFRGVDRGVANIEKKENCDVPIVLWRITEACEKSLDVYEGYPNLYTKSEIEVKQNDGKIVSAMAYVMTAQYENRPAEPTKHYFGIIETGYIENELPLRILREALNTNYDEIIEFAINKK